MPPAEAGACLVARTVLAADPALVAQTVEQIEEIGIVDLLARVRFETTGIAGYLDVGNEIEVLFERARQVSLGDLNVIDIELKTQVRRADPVALVSTVLPRSSLPRSSGLVRTVAEHEPRRRPIPETAGSV